MRVFSSVLIVIVIVVGQAACLAEDAASPGGKTWKFVSIPDFLNVDVRYPEPKWDDALDYVLKAIEAERPDFVIVAGDEVMGRWWKGAEQIEELGRLYYTDWCKRMEAHGLKYYVAVGDHELGDNPWRTNADRARPRCADIRDVGLYEQAFAKYFRMPANGPEHMKGLAYSVLHKNMLLVVVSAFEKPHMGEGRGKPTVTGKQLEWVRATLKKHADVDHAIVVGHPPILGPVRAESSSRLMLSGGADSPLWKAMTACGADLYLCGEVHAITCIERDGIQQIAHGGLFGYNDVVNYLVATVGPERIELELKAIKTDRSGGNLPQSFGNQPREFVRISADNKKAGFRSVGKMVIDKAGGRKALGRKTGMFLEDKNPKTAAEATKQGNRILLPYLTPPTGEE